MQILVKKHTQTQIHRKKDILKFIAIIMMKIIIISQDCALLILKMKLKNVDDNLLN